MQLERLIKQDELFPKNGVCVLIALIKPGIAVN